MRTFLLKDDCTLSGRRLHRDERRVEGGGYVDLTSPRVPSGSMHALLPAHGFVEVPPEGMKKGEKLIPLDYNRSWTMGRLHVHPLLGIDHLCQFHHKKA